MYKAVIDIGTNSVRLAVADVNAQGITMLVNEIEMTRIGEGMGAEKWIQPEPLLRTSQTVERFVRTAQGAGAEHIRITATSAVREAANQKAVVEVIVKASGLPLDILSGEQEAQLSYQGAAMDFGYLGEVLAVLDIGGGSTELVYEHHGQLSQASVPIGAVRLAEGTLGEHACAEGLQTLLKADVATHMVLIGVGGTITSLAAMDQSLVVYDTKRVHGYCLTKEKVSQWRAQLAQMSLLERAALPGLMPKRADIILAGTMILEQMMMHLQAQEIIVSDKDLLYGLLVL